MSSSSFPTIKKKEVCMTKRKPRARGVAGTNTMPHATAKAFCCICRHQKHVAHSHGTDRLCSIFRRRFVPSFLHTPIHKTKVPRPQYAQDEGEWLQHRFGGHLIRSPRRYHADELTLLNFQGQRRAQPVGKLHCWQQSSCVALPTLRRFPPAKHLQNQLRLQLTSRFFLQASCLTSAGWW